MDDLDALARLTARIENLEQRICTLEHAPAKSASGPVAVLVSASRSKSSQPTGKAIPTAQDGGAFAVLGKAMLGIAGAYVLRAIAESGSVPKLAVVILALGYAGTWLIWATRFPVEARLASTVYAITASLILAPMLWELTLRFQVLPTSVTAVVLDAFMITAYALAWKRSLTLVVWVTSVAGVLTTLGLLIATHDLVPFVSALLFMTLASEAAADCNHWPSLRPLVAVAADLAVWILVYIYSGPENVRSDYKSVATPVLLALGCVPFLIYGASIVFRTTRLRNKISFFEIGQTVVAFLLAAFSILRLGPGGSATVLGTLCLLFSAACYALAYAYFDDYHEERNYHVYATWSGALFLAGSALCFSPVPLALGLSVAAVVGTLLGVRASRLTLEFHGLAWLAVAAYASGLLDYAGRALVGTFPGAPGWIVWIVAASAVLCYAAGGRLRTERWNQRFLQLLSAVLAVAAVITFLVSVLVWLAAVGMTISASHVAVIRTLITCTVALALAFSGSRWERTELVGIAYGILALVTAKLLFEDLQHGHPGSTAVSIFLYAVSLIVVPRMARVGRRA